MENFVLFDAKLLRFELLDKPMAAVPAVSPFVGCFDQPLPLLPELIDAVSAKTDVVASTAERLFWVGAVSAGLRVDSLHRETLWDRSASTPA